MDLSKEKLLEMYKKMVTIRAFEQSLSDAVSGGTLPGFVHLGIGQEAIHVGVAYALRSSDWVSSTHRDHGMLIARGADIKRMRAEIFGKATGYCKGKGGSMHLAVYDKCAPGCNGILGPSPNDGGQSHSWPHHNGAVTDPQQWLQGRELYDIADILAFEDRGEYLYVAGDCTRAYSPDKLEYFTRQILFLRPGTFVIFDRVCSTNPQFQKTWLLQAMKEPTVISQDMVLTNGNGRLFIQTLLPENPQIKLVSGEELYSYGGQKYPPSRNTGPAPQCRIEISPPEPAAVDYFLHVLTATDAATTSVEKAAINIDNQSFTIIVGPTEITFTTHEVGGNIIISGHTDIFADRVTADPIEP